MSNWYIGIMSGTSMDGVDSVLVDFQITGLKVLQHVFIPFPASLQKELLALNQPSHNELHRAATAANQLVNWYAQSVEQLLSLQQLLPSEVQAIGVHGQTVRHRPQEFDGVGYTLQINNPALLAELTQIKVIADFRTRDVAAGGQGAPLVPAFHQAVFGSPTATRVVVNIGGIANLSVLKADGSVLGWDCGPGNALMDFWCARHTGQAFDRDGAWAKTGQLQPALLSSLASDPFLHKPPPKSTGRDLFNPPWLQQHLALLEDLQPADVQATLCAFTALACSQDLLRHAPETSQLVVCGGGALNDELMRLIAAQLPGISVLNSEALGLPPLQVEAAAFAWLAFKTIRRETSSLPSVTGAQGARVLGAIYPA